MARPKKIRLSREHAEKELARVSRELKVLEGAHTEAQNQRTALQSERNTLEKDRNRWMGIAHGADRLCGILLQALEDCQAKVKAGQGSTQTPSETANQGWSPLP
jgi:chromosome segregation ATPase